MELLQQVIKVFVALFAIVGPLSAVPIFLSMTPTNTQKERRRMAKLACMVATIVLFLFAVGGQLIFSVMGITLPAFHIAGGLLLFRIGYDMLHARESESKISAEERDIGEKLDSVAVTPLAVPLLAGPGAISTSILLIGEASGWLQKTVVLCCIPAVMITSYYVFRFSADGAAWISPIVLKVIRRLTGLILAAMAVQFVFNGLQRTPWCHA
jgi:multiple antibiotic resistance protein